MDSNEIEVWKIREEQDGIFRALVEEARKLAAGQEGDARRTQSRRRVVASSRAKPSSSMRRSRIHERKQGADFPALKDGSKSGTKT